MDAGTEDVRRSAKRRLRITFAIDGDALPILTEKIMPGEFHSESPPEIVYFSLAQVVNFNRNE